MMDQWLRLCTSTTGSMGAIHGWGTKILLALQQNQKDKRMDSDISYTSMKLLVKSPQMGGSRKRPSGVITQIHHSLIYNYSSFYVYFMSS